MYTGIFALETGSKILKNLCFCSVTFSCVWADTSAPPNVQVWKKIKLNRITTTTTTTYFFVFCFSNLQLGLTFAIWEIKYGSALTLQLWIFTPAQQTSGRLQKHYALSPSALLHARWDQSELASLNSLKFHTQSLLPFSCPLRVCFTSQTMRVCKRGGWQVLRQEAPTKTDQTSAKINPASFI